MAGLEPVSFFVVIFLILFSDVPERLFYAV